MSYTINGVGGTGLPAQPTLNLTLWLPCHMITFYDAAYDHMITVVDSINIFFIYLCNTSYMLSSTPINIFCSLLHALLPGEQKIK